MNLQQFTQPFWVSFGNYLTASTKEEQATEHLFIYHLTVLCFATFSESFGTTPLGTFPRFRFWINVANRFASARRQKVNCWETHLHLFAVHLWAFPVLPALLPPWPLLQLIAPCLLLIVFVFSLPSLATLRAITFQALVFIIILLNFFLGTDIEMDACN